MAGSSGELYFACVLLPLGRSDCLFHSVAGADAGCGARVDNADVGGLSLRRARNDGVRVDALCIGVEAGDFQA